MSSIYSFAPTSAYAGDTVEILGHLFTGATSVTFGGVPVASYVVDDDGTIHAIVGNGGASGSVAVAGPAGSAADIGFTFLGARSKKRVAELTPLGRTAAPGDLLMGWDGILNQTRSIDVAELPFTDGGGGGGIFTSVPSPFKVFNYSDNYTYDAVTNSVKIRDTRLLNKIMYPVATTQFGGGEFEDSKLTYTAVDPDDDTMGNVVISGFQLDDGAHITLTVPGDRDPSGDAVYAQLLADVALLKLIAAPFYATALGANGAKVLWNRPASEIPAGWQEWIDIRGRMPIAMDTGDPDFETLGATGGEKSHTLTEA